MAKSFHISMPDAMGKYVEEEISRGQFEGASEFFRALVRERMLGAALDPQAEQAFLHRLDEYEREGGVKADHRFCAERRRRRSGDAPTHVDD